MDLRIRLKTEIFSLIKKNKVEKIIKTFLK
jgi:hypothetical protein